jgi:hypothetical protein
VEDLRLFIFLELVSWQIGKAVEERKSGSPDLGVVGNALDEQYAET